MEVDGHRLHVSASIGLAVSPPVDPEVLLRSADAAVYYAKSQGRAQVRAFVGELSARAEERVHLSSDLRDAIEQGQLHLIYQPIVDIPTGVVLGIEALSRWNHPERGAIPPDVFVNVAEETGLSRGLDEWVVGRACTEMAELLRRGDVSPQTYVAVNITASSIGDARFSRVVAGALVEAALPPSTLVIEVTETGVMRDVDAGIRTLTALRELGVRVAIDDFGTGWSSLSYLKRLPASILKLDRSFVARLHEDEEDLAIAAAVMALGRATGIAIVAEGVETHEQLEVLRQLRCPAGQGYLWHKGVPQQQVAQAVRRTGDISRPADPTVVQRLRAAPASSFPVTRAHGLDRLYEIAGQGASMATVAAALNREGYRTPRGTRWHAKAVAAVMGAPALAEARARNLSDSPGPSQAKPVAPAQRRPTGQGRVVSPVAFDGDGEALVH
jgi:EAL domain-containing protein (putative c-di-GMP-specific phosphodiesterase class I)